jgi:hypothetical protein
MAWNTTPGMYSIDCGVNPAAIDNRPRCGLGHSRGIRVPGREARVYLRGVATRRVAFHQNCQPKDAVVQKKGAKHSGVNRPAF